ncbi:MAG: F0F1 ATP synthase subunit alpha, partial [Pseudomonadota bacterium]|nr:F0F1 ATP synthase subunit alpha [Pseudomonadota bacterium]
EKGFLKDVELNKILDFEAALLSFMNSEYADLMKTINETGNYNADIESQLNDALTKFKATQTW